MRGLFQKLLGAAALLMAPSVASAIDVGSTYFFGGTSLWGAAGQGWLGFPVYPSLDLRLEPLFIQIHVLEFIQVLTNDDIYLGANVLFPIGEKPIAGSVTGTFGLGPSIDLYAGNNFFEMGVAAVGFLGAEAGEDMGVGVYVAPELGVWLGDDTDLLIGGSLQVSIWL